MKRILILILFNDIIPKISLINYNYNFNDFLLFWISSSNKGTSGKKKIYSLCPKINIVLGCFIQIKKLINRWKNSSFIKLTLLNRWKRIGLIIDPKTKVTFIKNIGGKEKLLLHWKVKCIIFLE